MVLPRSCLRKSFHSLAGCMAAALSCTHAANAADVAFPEAVGRWAAATRDSDRIDRHSIALPPYLQGRCRDRLNVTRDSSHPGATLVVTNCDDSGAGSLRDTIAAAVSGDTIDLTQLTCSTITLTSAMIRVLQDDLAINGPGAATLAIDGGGALSQFAHYGQGTFSLDGITLSNGYYSSQAQYAGGGCLYSAANVTIGNSLITQCSLQGHVAEGGAIWTRGDLTLVNTVVTRNRVNGTSFSSAGGAYVIGDLTMQYSTIANNVASNVPQGSGQHSVGGGVHTFGNVLIQNSTISGNQAKNVAGLVFEADMNTTPSATIVNSTISENSATEGGPFGGAYTAIPLTLYNTTIAFNSNSGQGCSGLFAYNAPVILQSSILSDNVSIDLLLRGTATVSGANNLINNADTVPADTIRDCPQLGPLADNGGITLTHMPRSTSPAVDAGNNRMGLTYDQRGTTFPRIFGANADIGAVEWQGGADEQIFNSGFESICDQ
jgi:hypothetical protein